MLAEERERSVSTRRPAERIDLGSRNNRYGGSGSREKERQGLKARRAALGTELCGISISGFGYGIALDKAGNVWFCQIGGGKLGRLDPRTGRITDLALGRGSQPRRMAVAPDGSLWVTLYGHGKLVRVDPVAGKVVKEYALPAGSGGGPYAVTIDGAGAVWANEISTDTVVRLDPKTDQIRVFALPSTGAGIRKMIVDSQGRLWYMGSHNGRLGVIE